MHPLKVGTEIKLASSAGMPYCTGDIGVVTTYMEQPPITIGCWVDFNDPRNPNVAGDGIWYTPYDDMVDPLIYAALCSIQEQEQNEG